MTVGIIGNGITGGALRRWLKAFTNHQIAIYDPPLGYSDAKVLSPCDAVFVSVPVPTNEDGDQDISILVESLDLIPKSAHAFIRSTVLPTTTDRLANELGRPIYFMPEFLTARRAFPDFKKHSIIAGCVDDPAAQKTLRDIFQNLALGLPKPCHFYTNQECELGKYTQNVFGALSVHYFNLINQICNKFKISYNDAIEVAASAKNMSTKYSQVPGPDGKMGFSGSCFPKDLLAFSKFFYKELENEFFFDVYEKNKEIRGADV